MFVVKVKLDNFKFLPSWQDYRGKSVGDREKAIPSIL